MWWMMIVGDRMPDSGRGCTTLGVPTLSFRMPVPRRCAQCHDVIELEQEAWAFDHHVFDSLECVEAWIAAV